jgi:cyanophycin synthetase
MAGMQTGFGKARQTSVRGVYKVAFRTRQEQVGRAALAAGRGAADEADRWADAAIADAEAVVDAVGTWLGSRP